MCGVHVYITEVSEIIYTSSSQKIVFNHLRKSPILHYTRLPFLWLVFLQMNRTLSLNVKLLMFHRRCHVLMFSTNGNFHII